MPYAPVKGQTPTAAPFVLFINDHSCASLWHPNNNIPRKKTGLGPKILKVVAEYCWSSVLLLVNICQGWTLHLKHFQALSNLMHSSCRVLFWKPSIGCRSMIIESQTNSVADSIELRCCAFCLSLYIQIFMGLTHQFAKMFDLHLFHRMEPLLLQFGLHALCP